MRRLRVLLLGNIPSELRAEMDAAFGNAEWVVAEHPSDSADLLHRERPHLVVIGERPPLPVSSFSRLDPTDPALLVPVMTVAGSEAGDLHLPDAPPAREAVLHAARRLAARQAALLDRVAGHPAPLSAPEPATDLPVALTDEFDRAKNSRTPLSVIVTAVENVETLTARYGPGALETWASTLGSAVRRILRSSDRLFRSPSHRLIALLPETPVEGARIAAARIASQAAGVVFRSPPEGGRPGLPVKVRVRTGVAQGPSADLDSAEALLDAAEATLESEPDGTT